MGRSDYSLACDRGCPIIDHDTDIKVSGDVAVIRRYVNHDKTKAVWVGYDDRVKKQVVLTDDEAAKWS